MNVWILTHETHDDRTIFGVFSSTEKAKEWALQHKRVHAWLDGHAGEAVAGDYEIERYTVDGE